MRGEQLTDTLGGTALTIAGILDPENLLKTIILAVIGAVISLLVSSLMKVLFRRSPPKSTETEK